MQGTLISLPLLYSNIDNTKVKRKCPSTQKFRNKNVIQWLCVRNVGQAMTELT